ncbi:uncharacterized protein LOC132621497 isoform X2 [Lycium barbarum]|uniref:uncharacterized protein LOC132621497 isoform X2 n=1 Tax=Lycium barbarum TaxID=112863 RepID=UPI00293F63CD|nr:uncharacterized protein LOC132621497 isoform X2 [Lycium barbarum]
MVVRIKISGDQSNSGTQIKGGTTNKTITDGMLTTKGIGELAFRRHTMDQEFLCANKETNLHLVIIKINKPVYSRIIMNKPRRLQIFCNQVLPIINLLGRIFWKRGCREVYHVHCLPPVRCGCISFFFSAAQQKHTKLDNFLEDPPLSTKCLHALLNFDGASKGNPGLAGAGAVLQAADGSLGVATNNVAEYRGVILGLKYALEKGFKHIRVQGGSKLVCMQTQGIWKTENQNMAELSKIVKELKDQFMSFFSHVEWNSTPKLMPRQIWRCILRMVTQVECDTK